MLVRCPSFLIAHTASHAKRGGDCRQDADDNLNHSLPSLLLHHSFLSFFWARMATDGHGLFPCSYAQLSVSIRVNPCLILHYQLSIINYQLSTSECVNLRRPEGLRCSSRRPGSDHQCCPRCWCCRYQHRHPERRCSHRPWRRCQ